MQFESLQQKLAMLTNQQVNGRPISRFKAEISKRMRFLKIIFEDLYDDDRFDDEMYKKVKIVFLEIDEWLDFLKMTALKHCDEDVSDHENNMNDDELMCTDDEDDLDMEQFDPGQTIENANCNQFPNLAIENAIEKSKEGILGDVERVQANVLVPDNGGSSQLEIQSDKVISIQNELKSAEIGQNFQVNPVHERESVEIQQKSGRDDCAGTSFNTDNALEDTKSHENSLICYICKEDFPSIDDLRSHLRKHRGLKFGSCKFCDKVFSRGSSLAHHLRSHTGENSFKCDICDKVFRLSDTLKAHLNTHSGEEPYKCDTCDKAYITNDQLKLHSQTHTGETPFTCNVCGEAFGQDDYLQTHLRVHSD